MSFAFNHYKIGQALLKASNSSPSHQPYTPLPIGNGKRSVLQ